MQIAKMTSKGQVTVPKAVRDALHLDTGDKLEFIIKGNRDALIRPVTKKVDDVFGRLQKPGRKPVSVKEMDLAVKQRMKSTFK
jgi:antitoxin PrlF